VTGRVRDRSGASGRPSAHNDQVTALIELPEIGPVSAEQLIAVGIADAERLRAVGAREAFERIRDERDPGACLNLLLALEAAVRGVRVKALDDATKADLRSWWRALPRTDARG